MKKLLLTLLLVAPLYGADGAPKSDADFDSFVFDPSAFGEDFDPDLSLAPLDEEVLAEQEAAAGGAGAGAGVCAAGRAGGEAASIVPPAFSEEGGEIELPCVPPEILAEDVNNLLTQNVRFCVNITRVRDEYKEGRVPVWDRSFRLLCHLANQVDDSSVYKVAQRTSDYKKRLYAKYRYLGRCIAKKLGDATTVFAASLCDIPTYKQFREGMSPSARVKETRRRATTTLDKGVSAGGAAAGGALFAAALIGGGAAGAPAPSTSQEGAVPSLEELLKGNIRYCIDVPRVRKAYADGNIPSWDPSFRRFCVIAHRISNKALEEGIRGVRAKDVGCKKGKKHYFMGRAIALQLGDNAFGFFDSFKSVPRNTYFNKGFRSGLNKMSLGKRRQARGAEGASGAKQSFLVRPLKRQRLVKQADAAGTVPSDDSAAFTADGDAEYFDSSPGSGSPIDRLLNLCIEYRPRLFDKFKKRPDLERRFDYLVDVLERVDASAVPHDTAKNRADRVGPFMLGSLIREKLIEEGRLAEGVENILGLTNLRKSFKDGVQGIKKAE